MGKTIIGAGERRIEDGRFVTGTGTYIDDINMEGQAYAMVLRSPYAHADIRSIDTSDALAVDGVLLIVTGEEWQREGYGTKLCRSAVKEGRDGKPFVEPPHHCIAIDRVRYVGEAVAVVVAESATVARDALELIDVDYEPLPAVTDVVDAVADGAPQIWDDAPQNTSLDWELGDAEKTAAVFDKAERVVTVEIVNNRVTGAPIEPRGALAAYDAASDEYVLYNASQNVHANRKSFAEEILNIDSGKLRHIAPDVGGGFGAKNGVYSEPPLILYAARVLGRPVKWINDRTESFLSDTHGRGQVSRVQLALDNDGTFRGLRTESLGDLGAYLGTTGVFTPTGGSARTQGGPYGFDAVYYRGRAVFTNTVCMDPYRGAGRPEGSYQLDRVIERAARELGMDPVELKRKNLIPAERLPLKTDMGLDVDCGNFPEVFERALAMTDRAGFAARAKDSRGDGKLRGFAISPYLECTGGGPKEFAGVGFNSDGTVELAVGSQSTGMGHETSLPQILAAKLGIDMDRVRYVQGDTSATPLGGGHGGSRGLELGGNAVLQAAGEVIEKGRRHAARTFETDVGNVEFEDGRFFVPGTNQTLGIDEAIDGAGGEMNTETVFERGIISIPNGCHAAEVEVDPETGVVKMCGFWVVDDFGTIINPMLADGQVMGGVVQGIGQALLEQSVYDPDSGQLQTATFLDYALPRADDVPPMSLAYYEDAPTKKNPLGVKGAGEAGCCGSPPAVVNAVLDALKDYGVTHIDMPLTPEKVWRAINGDVVTRSFATATDG